MQLSSNVESGQTSAIAAHSECVICGNDFPFKLPPAIVSAANKGNLVIFAGAGVSTERPGFFPQSLYEELKSTLTDLPADDSFPSIMTGFESEFGRLELVEQIIKRINYAKSFSSLRFMVSRFYRELATIAQIREVITTNWDDYFERFCDMQPIVNDRDYVFYNLPGRKVYKIHGSINNVSTIVATLDDYQKCEEMLRNTVIGGTLRHLLGTKTVVFVGYSLKDEDFKNVYTPLIEGMDALRPITYVVSPFDVENADRYKLHHIKTDGSTFLRSLKQHLVDMGENLPDSIRERIEDLRNLTAECHTETSGMDWRNHPLLTFSLAYQDGLLDALGRMSLLFNTGDFNHIPHIQHIVGSYGHLLHRAVEDRRYWDAAYIDGYQNAYLSLLIEDDEVRDLPLYELFDPDIFPPENLENSESEDESKVNNQSADDEITEESGAPIDDSSDAESPEGDLPSKLRQEELVEILSDMEEYYPKLFEEANKIVSAVSDGYVPDHPVFLDGIIEAKAPAAII